MIYHDVLGVTVLANASQIEEAYKKLIDTLKESKFDSECPELYSRKIKELSKAKAECLAYIKMPFEKKIELETSECVTKTMSTNVTNSCCCGDGCETCCTVTCCSIIGILALGFLGWICEIVGEYKNKYDTKQKSDERKRQENQREERRRQLEEQRRVDMQTATILESQRNEAETRFENAKKNHQELQTKLSVLESQLSILEKFFDSNDVTVNLKESTAYVSLCQQIDIALTEEHSYRNELNRIISELNEIAERDREYQQFIYNRTIN